MEVVNPICNTFIFGNFFQISTDFELFKILGKTDLTELWSDRLLVTLIANPSKLYFG
jgi:hypothetical protein